MWSFRTLVRVNFRRNKTTNAKRMGAILFAGLCLSALILTTSAQAVCFPGSYAGTVAVGNVISGQRVCYPSQSGGPQGCVILTFSSSQAWGTFSKTVETFPADYSCPTGGQRGYFVAFSGNLGGTGYTRPKWQVVGLTYAPPGMHSTVTYSSGFLNGTSVSTNQSFANNLTLKVTNSGSFTTPAGIGGSASGAVSVGWTQETDSSKSISIQNQNTSGIVVPGPVSSAAGVDHDYDIFYVWLNPELAYTVFPGSEVDFAGFAYDQRDTITGMDVVPLTVGQLKGSQTIPSDLQARINRTWDTTLGGLISADRTAIVAVDPFANNPSFNPNTDTSGRFEFPEINNSSQDLIINYIPAAPGEQPSTSTYSSLYNSTSTTGQGGKDTFTLGISFDGSVNFVEAIKTELSVSDTMTWTNQWSRGVTSGTSQTANFSIVGPASTDNYTGPTAVQVWKDNIYGTFMFYPEN